MGHGGVSLRSQQGQWFARSRSRGLRRSSCGCGRFPSVRSNNGQHAVPCAELCDRVKARKAGQFERQQHASVACSLLMAWNRSALCKSPCSRRNAQPLRCLLASLPLSLALPVFHSSFSSSVAHSSSIKPAPLVRLLLDIPEVKHLHPRVTSTTNLLYLPISPFATPRHCHRPFNHSFPACLQLDCIRILPPLAHVSFQTRTTIRLRPSRSLFPNHLHIE
jgi:hypothetical protein